MTRTLNKWKDNKNRALIAISVYMVAVLLRSLVDIAVWAFDLNIDVILFVIGNDSLQAL